MIRCAPSTHTLATLPPLSYPPVVSSVLEEFCLKSFCMHFFVGTEAKGIEMRRGTLPLPSRRREGKVQLNGGEVHFISFFKASFIVFKFDFMRNKLAAWGVTR